MIEDTLELNTFLEDSCSRLETDDELTLSDLVKNSLRMRPERVIVGEVRGAEARDMMTAVNIGKYCMGTIHALTARETITRLHNEPMNVPEVFINLIDVFVILKRYHVEGKLYRVIDEYPKRAEMGYAYCCPMCINIIMSKTAYCPYLPARFTATGWPRKRASHRAILLMKPGYVPLF